MQGMAKAAVSDLCMRAQEHVELPKAHLESKECAKNASNSC